MPDKYTIEAQDPGAIKPNAKFLFNDALPGAEGGHVLALRTNNSMEDPYTYVSAHMQELKDQHNVKTISLEQAPYMMILNWAYRDAEPGPAKDRARRRLVNGYIGYSLPPAEIAIERANMAIAAIDNGIEVICADARLTFDEHKANVDKNNAYIPRRTRFRDMDTHAQCRLTMEKLEEMQQDYPEYADKLASIEHSIKQMRREGVPTDIISATIATELANPEGNMVAYASAGLVNGQKREIRGRDGVAPYSRTNGIFDEGLDHASVGDTGKTWKVTDGVLGSEWYLETDAGHMTVPEFENDIGQLVSNRHQCSTYDYVDFLIATDKDEVTMFRNDPTTGKEQLISNSPNLESLMNDFNPSPDSAPFAEDVYSKEALNPRLIPGLEGAISSMREAYNRPTAPAQEQQEPVAATMPKRESNYRG